MMRAVVELFFPKGCLSCRERVRSEHLFCNDCLLAIERISPKERCSKCFMEKGMGFCKHEKRDRRFTRQGALFLEGSLTDVLLLDIPRHSKILAAYFFLQLTELNWPPFTQVIAQKGWERVAIELFSFLERSDDKRILFVGEKNSAVQLDDRLLSFECFLLTLNY